MIMNTYNLFESSHEDTILYHAIARDEQQVVELANEAGIDIEGLVIELERKNVKDELGRSYEPSIRDAQVY